MTRSPGAAQDRPEFSLTRGHGCRSRSSAFRASSSSPPAVFRDARGSFSETWNRAPAGRGWARARLRAGQPFPLRRARHAPRPALPGPAARAGQARALRAGRIWDVAVDIRRARRPTGGGSGAELSPENGQQILVPKGFLHGFVTLEPDTEVLYKCTDTYAPDCDGAVLLGSSCGIDWPSRGRAGAVGQGRRRAGPRRLRQPLHLGAPDMKILVTGGAGLHRLGRRAARRGARARDRQRRRADLCRLPRQRGRRRRRTRLRLRTGRHPRPRRAGPDPRRAPARRDHAPRGREPCRPLHRRRPAPSSRPT